MAVSNITIKKPDGTLVTVSLADFKKNLLVKQGGHEPIKWPASAKLVENSSVAQKAVARPVAKPISPVVSPKKTALVATGQPTDSSILPPVPFDSRSLLEDDEPVVNDKNSPSKTANARGSEVEAVLKKLSFSVPADFNNRLRSVILLRLKEVRGRDETRVLSLRSIKEGGLGLTEAQAKILEDACVQVAGLDKKIKPAMRLDNSVLPTKTGTVLPADTSPNNAFVHAVVGAKNNRPSATTRPATALPRPLAGTNLKPTALPMEEKKDSLEKFKISSLAPRRDMVDVAPAASAPLGPIDEIKIFSLEDFRRLGPDAAQSASRLAQKFVNLKEDSVILFWQAISAWRMSPLFLAYVNKLTNALLPRFRPVSNTDSPTEAEIKALIIMEKKLGI